MSHVEHAETPKWDLSFLYSGPDDPQIDVDLAEIERRQASFAAAYKGRLDVKLAEAFREYLALVSLAFKPEWYLSNLKSLDQADARVAGRLDAVEARLAASSGEHMTFFALELIRLPEETVRPQVEADPLLAKHRHWIERVRAERPHVLSWEVESALVKRSPYGSSAWEKFHDEVSSDMRFSFDGEELNMSAAFNRMSYDPNPEVRARLLKAINAGMIGGYEKMAAFSLSQVAGAKAVEDRERKEDGPMARQIRDNELSKASVEALHQAVLEVAGPLARRFYRLKAEWLNVPVLAWSDRNAPVPFEDRRTISFEDAQREVLEAYESFSPTLADLIRQTLADGRIDAGAEPTRRGGAYNSSVVLPDGRAASLVFMNWHGTIRDKETLAHEEGHQCHGLLAGGAQGALMQHAGTALAETASIFGEMTVFDFERRRLEKAGDPKALLALLASKIDDQLNTVVRQISFSEFEQRVHGAGRRLSPAELSGIWVDVTRQMYGEDGEAFRYRDMDRLWAYIHHFWMLPFYVFSYAYSELLVQRLYAVRPGLGERFEPLYLELLRAGCSRPPGELLAPFGLDPDQPTFWREAIEGSLGRMIGEAEEVWRSMKKAS
jgi:oligoendopeptidase F